MLAPPVKFSAPICAIKLLSALTAASREKASFPAVGTARFARCLKAFDREAIVVGQVVFAREHDRRACHSDDRARSGYT